MFLLRTGSPSASPGLLIVLSVIFALFGFSCGDKSNGISASENPSSTGQPTRITGSPYPVSQKPDTLFIVEDSNFSDSQLLTVQSLMGILAQSKPRIYRSHGTGSSLWLNDLMKDYGVTIDRTYRADFQGLMTHFKNSISGYILSTVAQPSIHVAISLAGLKNAIVVTGVDEQTVKDLGLPLIEDVTQMNFQSFIDSYGNEINKNILCYQTAEKYQYLSDYSIFGKMYFFFDNISGSLTANIFSSMKPNAPLLGWGTDEYQLVSTASRNSIIVHAADWALNLSVLSNFGVETKQSQYNSNPTTIQNVHTVCFVMTDGDNVQWLLNDFSTNTRWYGSPNRGTVPLGWTVSPALSELAPTVLKRFYDNASHSENRRDYFIASPSGLGYIYPDLFPQRDSYAALTDAFLKKADLRIVNIIGNSLDDIYLSSLMNRDQIDGIFYYYYSNYAGGHGVIHWINGKPVITGRFNLWSPQFETPQSLATKLNSLSTDITTANGYSLISVHVWSHSVDDVVQCVKLLNKNVRVVSPDEFVGLIRQNVGH